MITDQEHLNNLVTAAFHREMEIYQYQINVDNYTVMLDTLHKDDWPEELLPYKEAAIDRLPESLDDAIVDTISEYQYRDRIKNLLRTERVEQNKSIRVRNALKSQIGADYDTLLATYKAAQA
jgi:hypothetical protein